MQREQNTASFRPSRRVWRIEGNEIVHDCEFCDDGTGFVYCKKGFYTYVTKCPVCSKDTEDGIAVFNEERHTRLKKNFPKKLLDKKRYSECCRFVKLFVNNSIPKERAIETCFMWEEKYPGMGWKETASELMQLKG